MHFAPYILIVLGNTIKVTHYLYNDLDFLWGDEWKNEII